MRFVATSAVAHFVALTFVLIPGTSWADDLLPGEPVENGIIADITPAGLDFIESLAPSLVPAEMPLDPIVMSQEIYWECDLDLTVGNMIVHLELNSIDVVPQTDTLRIDINLDVWISTEWDPTYIDMDFDGWTCLMWDQTCYMWTDVITVTATMYISMEIIDPGNGDPPYLEATVPPVTHNLDSALTSNNIVLDGCDLATINEVLAFFGLDLVDLIIGEAAGELFAFIEEDLPTTIEEALEDAFDSATISEEMDVLGTTVTIDLVPNDVQIAAEGIRLAFNGAFDAPLAACIEQYDPGGSSFTDGPAPILDGAATYHAGAFLSDDLINAALYTFWRGGILCYVVDPAEMGFPLDTSFLALMANEEDRWELERLWFGDSETIAIRTVPKNVPTVDFNGANDLILGMEDLGLEFYAFTQDRLSRVMTVDVDVDAGMDIVAPGDGSIAVEVSVDTADLSPLVSYNEFVPDLNEQIEQNFNDIMSGLLDTILDGFLSDLTFGPMLMMGIGLSGLDIAPAGTNNDWLGAYATIDILDPEGMGDIGCTEEGGVGCDSGCEDGCTEDCSSSCDVDRRRRVRSLWAGNLMLLGICIGVVAYFRRRG